MCQWHLLMMQSSYNSIRPEDVIIRDVCTEDELENMVDDLKVMGCRTRGYEYPPKQSIGGSELPPITEIFGLDCKCIQTAACYCKYINWVLLVRNTAIGQT